MTAPAARSQEWTENRPTRGFHAVDLHELWRYRELALALAVRDLKVRYKQAVFGVLWALLQPLAGAAVFTLVFARMAHVASDGVPYALFAYVGTAAWTYHAATITAGTESLVQDAALVTKIYFPKLLSPLATGLTPLLDLGIALAFLAVLLPVYGVVPTSTILGLPIAVAFVVVVSFSFSLWFSALNVRYRDVRYVVRFAVQIWLFATPVAYPLGLVGGPWRWVYAANPMVAVVSLFRWAVLGAPLPATTLAIGLAVTAIVLVSGLAYFQSTERRFADVI